MRKSDKQLIALFASLIVVIVVVVTLLVNSASADNPDGELTLIYLPVEGAEGDLDADDGADNETPAARADSNDGRKDNAGSAVGAAQTNPQSPAQGGASPQGGAVQNGTVAQGGAVQNGNAAAQGGNANNGQQGVAVLNPATASKQEILSYLTDAVNRTKSYGGSLTVHHTENFTANVTECTGGDIVAKVVSWLVGLVVKPKDETLSFVGGSATDSDGEAVSILLPQDGSFRLSMSGVESISASAEGQNTVVNVSLVPESVGMYETPAANASGIGFLDVRNFNLSFMEITKADIQYTGSSIRAYINPSGYVVYAEYNIPLHIEGAAHAGPISGSAMFDGMQSEIWNLGL